MVSVLCLAEASVRKSLVTCLFKGKYHVEETVTWPGSHSMGYHFSMEERDLPKVITSGHKLYLEVLYHFFGTITFETTGYTL